MPRGMKGSWMVKTLTSMTTEMMGPSTMSVKEKGRAMSSIPRSLLKALISWPGGVRSKKRECDRTTPWIIRSCSSWFDSRITMFRHA